MAQYVNSIKVVPQITQKSNLKQFHLYVNYQNDFKKLISKFVTRMPKSRKQPTYSSSEAKCKMFERQGIDLIKLFLA
jgi:hypothetical protein